MAGPRKEANQPTLPLMPRPDPDVVEISHKGPDGKLNRTDHAASNGERPVVNTPRLSGGFATFAALSTPTERD